MDASQLRSLLRERPLVADGGIGSLIYQRLGSPRALCIEHTPLTHAETVLQIHLAYIATGAELVAVAGVLSATHDSPVRPVASPAHIQMTARLTKNVRENRANNRNGHRSWGNTLRALRGLGALDPPKGTNLARILDAVYFLKQSARVDVVDINSNPIARVIMSWR